MQIDPILPSFPGLMHQVSAAPCTRLVCNATSRLDWLQIEDVGSGAQKGLRKRDPEAIFDLPFRIPDLSGLSDSAELSAPALDHRNRLLGCILGNWWYLRIGGSLHA